MADRAKNEPKPTKEKTGYGNRLFRKEGTAAEPWPTAEDLWNDPEVKSAINVHNESVKKETDRKTSIHLKFSSDFN